MESEAMICIDGQLFQPASAGTRILDLFTNNYIYQQIHTVDHRPLHLHTHFELAAKAFSDLYGEALPLTEEEFELSVRRLLVANHCSRHSHTVLLRLFPSKCDPHHEPTSASYMLQYGKTLLYRGYTLWHTRMNATVATDEHTPPGYPTDTALRTARFCQQNACRHGFDLAIHENGEGIITGVGDAPVFCVKDRTLYTTPLTAGATDTVLRRLIFATCRRLYLKIEEIAIRTIWLGDCDEIFTADPQGLISIASLAGTDSKVYFNMMADYLGERLNDTELP